ncbi:hypothetical protein Tco_0712717, partial [Tanacetum coccineum]
GAAFGQPPPSVTRCHHITRSGTPQRRPISSTPTPTSPSPPRTHHYHLITTTSTPPPHLRRHDIHTIISDPPSSSRHYHHLTDVTTAAISTDATLQPPPPSSPRTTTISQPPPKGAFGFKNYTRGCVCFSYKHQGYVGLKTRPKRVRVVYQNQTHKGALGLADSTTKGAFGFPNS